MLACAHLEGFCSRGDVHEHSRNLSCLTDSHMSLNFALGCCLLLLLLLLSSSGYL